jgi:hypothetical protein
MNGTGDEPLRTPGEVVEVRTKKIIDRINSNVAVGNQNSCRKTTG